MNLSALFRILPLSLLLAPTLFALPPALPPPSAGAESLRLQISVRLPPATHPWVEDDLSEAVVNRMRTIFRREGFAGDVDEVTPLSEAEEAVPHLRLRVEEWRQTHTGMFRCTMYAIAVDAEGAETDLGVISATDFGWGNGGPWGRAYSFRDVADEVARKLWRRIERKGGWDVLFAPSNPARPDA